MLSDGNVTAAPGRVNLIGEHIDYHGLPVLPMAIDRRIRLRWRPRNDARIALRAPGFGACEFEMSSAIPTAPAGDWSNYARAAAQAAAVRWGASRGIEADVESDLPMAAGLSSSSALLVACALALLRANGVEPDFAGCMAVLPDAEHYVGTRGGGMDHAACLAGRRGCALRVGFEPPSAEPIPIPDDWAFVLIHSGVRAEKSAALREEYNRRRRDGAEALASLGLTRYGQARLDDAARLSGGPLRCFRHVVTETARVTAAVDALRAADIAAFGSLLNASHASLRDDLAVSCPELDAAVEAALRHGARGARLTGAGFGGYVLAVVESSRCPALLDALGRYYGGEPNLMKVTAGDGALQ